MKRISLFLFTCSALLFGASFANAAPCGAGSKGHCSWTCKGNVAQVTCRNPDGPDRCYVVDSSGSSSARCSDFKKYSSIGKMSLNDLVNYDKKRGGKIKAALIRTDAVIKKTGNQIKKLSGIVRAYNAKIQALVKQRTKVLVSLHKLRRLHNHLRRRRHRLSRRRR